MGVVEVWSVATIEAGQSLMQTIEVIWHLEMAYLAACVVGGLAIMIIALRRVHSVTARRQLRWVLSGAMFPPMISRAAVAANTLRWYSRIGRTR